MTVPVPAAVPDAIAPTALRETAGGQRYLAFLSYRRRDGAAVAQWLRQKIGTFEAPRDLRRTVEAADARVGGARNRVFLDASYQRSHADFWVDHIAPSVRRSEYLLLLLTPSVFEKLPDGEPNWVDREIATFLDAHGDPSRILLVLGPGAPDDRVPDAMARLSQLWDWADLRFFSTSVVARWRKGAVYDAQLTKILARLYDIGDGDLPALTNEFERARTKVHRRIYAAGAGAILGLSVLAGWAMVERGRAVAAEGNAIVQRDEAFRQRNAALKAQSLYLTQTSAAFQAQGSARQAMKLLLPALPDPEHGNDRPLVADAVVEAYKTLYDDRELGRIALPEGTTAAAVSADDTVLAAVGPRDVTLLSLPDGAVTRTLPGAGGDARNAEISPDKARLLLTVATGAVRAVDLGDGRILVQHPGFGAGTRGRFIDHGSKVVLQSAQNDRIALLDLASGAVVERGFKRASPLLADDMDATLLILADGAVRRLATADLGDATARPVADTQYAAMARAPNGGPVVLATGTDVLTGSYALLDPSDLAERQRFDLTLGTVSGAAVSADGKTLAVHTPPNLTFYDLGTGHALSTEGTAAKSGRFVGWGTYQDYAFAINGIIKVVVPGRNLGKNYKSEDEAELRDLAWDKDDLAFTSVTATPLVTRWSSKDVAARRRLRIEHTVKGVRFADWPPWVGAASEDGHRLAVSYVDGSVGLWDLDKAELVLNIEAREPPLGRQSLLALSPDGKILVRAEDAGRFVVFDLEGKTSRIMTVGDKPPSSLAFVSDRKLAVGAKGGGIFELDLADPDHPDRHPDALATCHDGVTRGGLAGCTADGVGRVVDLEDGRLLWQTEDPPALRPRAYPFGFLPKSGAVATVDGRGLLSVRSARSGARLWDLQLMTTLSASDLAAFRGSPLLDDADRAAVAAGGAEVAVKLPAIAVLVPPNERHAAVFFPDRSVQVVDLASHTIEATLHLKNAPLWMDFSANGDQMATIEAVGQDYSGGQIQVYDFRLKRVIVNTSNLFSLGSQVFHVGDGQGFVYLIQGRELTEIPVWERSADLIDAIKRKYPERLTSEERHAYYFD